MPNAQTTRRRRKRQKPYSRPGEYQLRRSRPTSDGATNTLSFAFLVSEGELGPDVDQRLRMARQLGSKTRRLPR